MDSPVIHILPSTPDDPKYARVVRDALSARFGTLRPRRIVLKPNWVLHETDPAFPIRALVTDPRLIELTLEACLELFPSAESILVADCPLQSCDWPLLCRQSGLDRVIDRFRKREPDRVAFRDLRQEVFAKDEQGFLRPSSAPHGDPRGYRVVSLGNRSHLEPLSSQAKRFAVNDYSTEVTRSNHAPGQHSYYVSQSILDADLFINLPKWKAHQKSALTGALKNLVGINGDKAYLPHFRTGAPRWGGDEYPDANRWLYWLQTTLRSKTQKRSRLLFQALRPGWQLLKRLRGLETRMTSTEAAPRNFYVAGGAWHGNDTIWRMIYDLNLVIQCADAEGRLRDRPQRSYFSIVDGWISGEGNGPLEALPRETGWLVFGNDPFAIDSALAHAMGFDPAKVPIVAHRQSYLGPDWGGFDLADLSVDLDGTPTRLPDWPANFHFAPPPGWRSHVER